MCTRFNVFLVMFVYTDTVCGFMIVTSEIMGFCIKKKPQPFIFDIVDFFFNYDERMCLFEETNTK